MLRKVSAKIMKELEAQRYGFPHDSDHYGDGGFAIYGADFKELYRLERLAGLRF